MIDDTSFSTTIAIHVNDNNKNCYTHCLAGILNQEAELLPKINVTILNTSSQTDNKYELGLLKILLKDKINWYSYQRVYAESLLDIYKAGFRDVCDKYSPQTPLFLFIPANYYLPTNFLKILQERFLVHRYTCFYPYVVLPKTGPKVYCESYNSVITSQICQELLKSQSAEFDERISLRFSHDLATMDRAGLIPKPWIISRELENIVVEEM